LGKEIEVTEKILILYVSLLISLFIFGKTKKMKNHNYSLLFLLLLATSCMAQKPNLAQRLGYAKDAKLLIIHADDLGVSHSVNAASVAAFEKGMVNSGSIMVPCPWFPEIANYSKAKPEVDLGLHLTLTAEWETYKWGPVTPIAAVPNLVNEQGFLYDNCADVVRKVSVESIEKELRAQVDRALAFGVNVSHLDSHMGCLFNPKYFETYLKVGRDYGLPLLIPASGLQQFPAMAKKILPTDIVIDNIFMLNPPDAKTGAAAYYANQLKNLPTGVSEMIIHIAYDDAEMQAVTINHPDFGAAWRQVDLDYFTSAECREILEEAGIQLITWGDLKALIGK